MNKDVFCKRLAESIKNSGYTQKEIANTLNICESNISNWKKGVNLPSIDILFHLCVLLQESADYFLGLDET